MNVWVHEQQWTMDEFTDEADGALALEVLVKRLKSVETKIFDYYNAAPLGVESSFHCDQWTCFVSLIGALTGSSCGLVNNGKLVAITFCDCLFS